MFIRMLSLGFFSLMLNGCMMSSSEVTVNKFVNNDLGIKKVTVSDNSYIAEMNSALIKSGFYVTPMPTQKELIALQSGEYDKEATRWIVKLETKSHGGYDCVTSNSNILDFTLILKDMTDNQIVMTLKQTGSDGPCGTIEPVFDTLAMKLSESWQ